MTRTAGLGSTLRRKPWPIFTAIEADELRVSMPFIDGSWLIRPADLMACIDRRASDVTGGVLESRDERRATGTSQRLTPNDHPPPRLPR